MGRFFQPDTRAPSVLIPLGGAFSTLRGPGLDLGLDLGGIELVLLALALYFALSARRRARHLQQVNLHRELEMQRRNRLEQELRSANRALTALSRCSRAVITASREGALLQEVCSIATQQAGYRLAWAGIPLHDARRSVLPLAHAGFEDRYLETVQISWSDCERGRGPTGRCIRSQQPVAVADVLTDPSFTPWREQAVARGFRSCISLPLRARGDLLGVLNLYAAEADAFNQEELCLLTELADTLGFGIASLRERAERERADHAVRQSERRLFQFLDFMPVGVYILDSTGAPYFSNQRAVVLLGRGVEGLASVRDLADAYQVFVTSTGEPYPPERFPIVCALQGTPASCDDIEVRSRGTSVPLEVVAAPIFDEKGRVEFAVAAFQDVSARREAEQKMQSYLQELQRSNAELLEFAAVASHDLQEPLRKIVAFGDRLQALAADQLDGEAREMLIRMQGAAGRMSRLIEDLLQYARVTTKAQPFAPVDLNHVLAAALEDLEPRIAAAQAVVEVSALPVVQADASQVQRLIQNLLANALKFRRPGVPPVITVSARENGGTMEITVADNGIGFDETYGERIFAPFVRLHSRAEYEGTGMGLAICRKIVARHGGRLWARSRPGEGSTFCFTLPLAHSAPAAAPALEEVAV